MVDGQLQEHSTVTLQSASTVSPITPNESTTVWWTPSTTQLNSGSLGKYGSATPVTENESTTIWWTPSTQITSSTTSGKALDTTSQKVILALTPNLLVDRVTQKVYGSLLQVLILLLNQIPIQAQLLHAIAHRVLRQAVIIGSKDLTWKKTLLCSGVIGVSLLLNLL